MNTQPVPHSPGPWTTSQGNEEDPHRWLVVAEGPIKWHIATIENGQPGDFCDTEEATAKLIAAAPELLDIVKSFMEFTPGLDTPSDSPIRSRAMALMANLLVFHSETPSEPVPVKTGMQRIQEERARQIAEEGWTAEHDDKHAWGILSMAANCYRHQAHEILEGGAVRSIPTSEWPWEHSWWKPSTDPIRNFEKAGALYLAEAERAARRGYRDSSSKNTEHKATRYAHEIGSMIDQIQNTKTPGKP